MDNPSMTQPEKALTSNERDEAVRALEVKAATQASSYMDPQVWKQMLAMSDVFIKAGSLPSYIKNMYQAVTVLQAGLEIDLKPIESFNSLYIVNGSINLWGKAVVKRFKLHGYEIKYEDGPDTCTTTVKRGDTVYTETYTFEEAQQSGYTEAYGKPKPGWLPGINRKLKLRYGCLSIIAKSYCPEVLGSADGIAEVAEDYTLIEEPKAEAGTPKAPMGGEPSKLGDFLNRKKAQNQPETTTKQPKKATKGTEKVQKTTKSDKPKAEAKGPEWEKKKRGTLQPSKSKTPLTQVSRKLLA